MPRLGHGLFAGVRHLRDRHAWGGKSSSNKNSKSSTLGLRRRTGTKVDSNFDVETPPLVPRRLHHEAKHFAGNSLCNCLRNSPTPDSLAEDEGSLLVESEQPDEGVAIENLAENTKGMNRDQKAKKLEEVRYAYWERKRKQQGENFNEDEILIKFARKVLLHTNSNSDLLMTAEIVIDEDWLGSLDALPGNIYRLAVMGDVFVPASGVSMSHNLQTMAKMLGVLLVILIQIAGPPMIFLSRTQGYGVLNHMAYKWQCCPWHPSYNSTSSFECYYLRTFAKDATYFDDWHHIASTKLLGMLLMVTFILNGLFVILDEKDSWKRIYNTFRYLDVLNPSFRISGLVFLYLDAFVNIWVIFWCCIDVFLVIGAAASPSDVVMNALALTFLYNLDDIGGDLGFVNEDDWPGKRLNWIYTKCVHPCDDNVFDEDKLDRPGAFALGLYNVTIFVLVVMTVGLPALAAFTPFIQIVPMD